MTELVSLNNVIACNSELVLCHVAFILNRRPEIVISDVQLVAAINHNNIPLLSLLLSHPSVKYDNAFLHACRYGSYEAVTLFLDSLTTVFPPDIFLKVIPRGDVSILSALLKDRRANLKNTENWLQQAAESESLAVVKLLVDEYGLDPSEDNYVALRIAITHNDSPMINYLLSDKRVVTRITISSPFNYVMSYGSLEVFRLLLEYASPTDRECIIACRKDNFDFFTSLILSIDEVSLDNLLKYCIKNSLKTHIQEIWKTKVIIFRPEHLLPAIFEDNYAIIEHCIREFKISACNNDNCLLSYALSYEKESSAYTVLKCSGICCHANACLKLCLDKNISRPGLFLAWNMKSLKSGFGRLAATCKDEDLAKAVFEKTKYVDHETICDLISDPSGYRRLEMVCKLTKIDLRWEDCKLIKEAANQPNTIALNMLLANFEESKTSEK